MTIKPKKATKESIAIESLRSWATKHQLLDDPFVKGLLHGVISRTNLPFWASKELVDLLPHAKSSSKTRMARIDAYLIIIRNVVVFIPVALTWSAVSHATNAFGIYTSANPNSVANFLQFWQNGYDVLAPEWKIGFVANLDFLLIAVVIALTLYTSVLQARSENQRMDEEMALEEERLRVALLVSEYLFDKQKVTTVTVNAGVNSSVQNLKNATTKLNETVKKIEKKIQL